MSNTSPQPVLTVLGIAGSLRAASFNRGLLRAAVELAPAAGLSITPFDIAPLPFFNQDHEQAPPESVKQFKAAIRAADAVLIVTPEYNFSIPGVLKNAIDCASRPYGDDAWNGKPAAIMGASVGNLGSARAQYHLRQVCVTLNLLTMNQPEVIVVNASQKFDAQGNLTEDGTRQHVSKTLAAFSAWIRRLKAGEMALK